MVTVLCTVRNCGQTLVRDERRMACANGHSFDVARSGYVNLLQPQDRRSKQPGDSREAVAARRRFIDAGYEKPVIDAIAEVLSGAPVSSPALDAGCGEGSHLAALGTGEAYGVDLSVPAIDLAARRYPQCHWFVANADRFIPFADASFSVVMSITARLNPSGFRRVLRNDGRLLVVLTAADDLRELRAIIHDEVSARDRVDRTAGTFAPLFTLERRERISSKTLLTRDAIGDVLASSYRGSRHREQEKLRGVDTLEVTLSRDLLLFRAS